MSAPGVVIPFSPNLHLHLVPYIAAIHAACITHDRTIATFLPPLSHEKLLTWWKDRINEVRDGSRVIYILLSETDPASKPSGTDVMGVVMLSMPWSETSPFQGVVEKLMVQSRFRGKGAAKSLMNSLEEDSKSRGRTLLTLDTETGSPAEQVFLKLGYNEVGQIPNYGKSPAGDLKSATFFWKQL